MLRWTVLVLVWSALLCGVARGESSGAGSGEGSGEESGEGREARLVQTAQGPVRGYKDPAENLYTFYGIPYATAPTGTDRYKAPLPGPSWITPFEADDDSILCPQKVFSLLEHLYKGKKIQQNCLVANIFVPNTTEKNIPVVVVVHGGGFQMGYGNFLKPTQLAQAGNVIVVTFNYRLGIHGFLCLGTEDAPGNAGMKDQVALLRWVKKNIANFGGNPDDVTISGYSAGSGSVDLLMLSPLTKGLFNKVIPESGGNLAVFAVQVDPLENARTFAKRYEVEDLNDVYALEEFYKTATFEMIASDLFFDVKDSNVFFSPCVERDLGQEVFLADSPYNILKSGNYEKFPLLYGFANMEGLFRVDWFDTWKADMNEKFSDFLPHDLQFKNDEEKEKVANEIKQFYFGDKPVSNDNILSFVDYYTDIIFAYPMLRAVSFHVKAGHDKLFLYEYSYVDEITPEVPHTDVRGATHCAQTAAIFDGIPMTNITERDLSDGFKEHKATMRQLWGNFIKTGTPVPDGSQLPAWPPAGAGAAPHMSLGRALELRGPLLKKRFQMWDAVYERHYRAPQKPLGITFIHNEL